MAELGSYWIRVICLECSKRFKTRTTIPYCPRCGGADVDLDYDHPATRLFNEPADAGKE